MFFALYKHKNIKSGATPNIKTGLYLRMLYLRTYLSLSTQPTELNKKPENTLKNVSQLIRLMLRNKKPISK